MNTAINGTKKENLTDVPMNTSVNVSATENLPGPPAVAIPGRNIFRYYAMLNISSKLS